MLAKRYVALPILLLSTCLAGAGVAQENDSSLGEATPQESRNPAGVLLASLAAPLRALVAEALERNPGLRALEAEARSAAEVAPQVKALPYPSLGVTAFVAPPETRVGPQRLMASYGQALPAHGKRALREQAALYRAAALEARVESARLALLTKVRRLAWELAFVDQQKEILDEFRDHLLQHEEIARARYSTGVGLGQAVIKIQAEITDVDRQLLALAQRRIALAEQINALRDRPPRTALARFALASFDEASPEAGELALAALRLRPEIDGARAELARAEVLAELAAKESKPDWTVGVSYTFVDPREDPAGRLQPPSGNGDDIIGLQGGVMLPVRKARTEGARREAAELHEAARQKRRSVEAEIRGEVGDLALRLPIQADQFRLVDRLLVVQAEESLESAQAAYIAGRLNALDLLDAEHMLFNAHTAVARAHADYLITLAELEGAVGAPLASASEEVPR